MMGVEPREDRLSRIKSWEKQVSTCRIIRYSGDCLWWTCENVLFWKGKRSHSISCELNLLQLLLKRGLPLSFTVHLHVFIGQMLFSKECTKEVQSKVQEKPLRLSNTNARSLFVNLTVCLSNLLQISNLYGSQNSHQKEKSLACLQFMVFTFTNVFLNESLWG